MDVKILKNEKDKLRIELNNQTIAELLRKKLWDYEDIEIAAWKKPHTFSKIILTIETKGKSAISVLKKCIEDIEKENEKLMTEIKKLK